MKFLILCLRRLKFGKGFRALARRQALPLPDADRGSVSAADAPVRPPVGLKSPERISSLSPETRDRPECWAPAPPLDGIWDFGPAVDRLIEGQR